MNMTDENNTPVRIEVTVRDTKYILPDGATEADGKRFEKEVLDAIRDGGEFTVPAEVQTIYNPGKKPVTDSERIMIMEAEMKELKAKQDALNKKIAEEEANPKATPDVDVADEDEAEDKSEDKGEEKTEDKAEDKKE